MQNKPIKKFCSGHVITTTSTTRKWAADELGYNSTLCESHSQNLHCVIHEGWGVTLPFLIHLSCSVPTSALNLSIWIPVWLMTKIITTNDGLHLEFSPFITQIVLLSNESEIITKNESYNTRCTQCSYLSFEREATTTATTGFELTVVTGIPSSACKLHLITDATRVTLSRTSTRVS